jgi:hypothetical protein
MTGRVEQGLALVDESMTALCAGELTEIASVDNSFCGLFWACELVSDVPRADQWIRATSEFMAGRNVVAHSAALIMGESSLRPGAGRRQKFSCSTLPDISTAACRRDGLQRSSDWPIYGSVRADWKRLDSC